MALAFFVALATMSALCLGVYFKMEQFGEAHAEVSRTYELLTVLGQTFLHVSEAETSQRGFILTGDDVFLSPYYANAGVLKEDLFRLRLLLSRNPSQKEALNSLEKLIQERLDRIREGIDIRRAEGFEAGQKYVSSKRGHDLMTEIRKLFTRIAEQERSALSARYNESQAQSRQMLLGFSTLGGVNFLLLGLAYFVVRKDLRQRRRTQEQQAKLVKELEGANQDLKDFAHIVSHDLKAPLRAIASLSLFLEKDFGDKLGGDGRQQLNLLQNRVQRMHDLIEGILQYSRISRLEENDQLTDLRHLVGQVVEDLSPPSHIEVEIGNGWPTLECQRTRARQVFQNLIGNAIKFMDKPRGKIKICAAEDEREWTFTVADNGPGIDPKYFGKIFQLFQTLAPRDELETAGIGLSVVKKAVERWGGKAWVESKVGFGSSFYFTIPKKIDAG